MIQSLIELRDKIKAASEREYNYAASQDNEEISRLELSFSNQLLKYSQELNKIISTEKKSSFNLRTSDNIFDEVRNIWDAAEINVLHSVGEICKGDSNYEENPICLSEYVEKYYS